MRRKVESLNIAPWVDIFSEQGFGGRLVRLRVRSGGKTTIFDRSKLPRIGSVIVGPGAIAEFTQRGGSTSFRLSQRTLLSDASRVAKDKSFQAIRVISEGK
jgi:hypothetical protein